jgi:hypothetical protein
MGWLTQRLGSQDALFTLHAALLLLGLGAVQPLNGLLAYRSWRWFLFLSAVTQAIKVLGALFGPPQVPS